MADKMRVLTDLEEFAVDEIQSLIKKENVDDKCFEWLYKLTDILKDTDTILAMNGYIENNGYSNKMPYPYYYNDTDMAMANGNSYRNMSGNYGRNDYHNNGYSRTSLRQRLERMMNEANTEHEREAIRNALDNM